MSPKRMAPKSRTAPWLPGCRAGPRPMLLCGGRDSSTISGLGCFPDDPAPTRQGSGCKLALKFLDNPPIGITSQGNSPAVPKDAHSQLLRQGAINQMGNRYSEPRRGIPPCLMAKPVYSQHPPRRVAGNLPGKKLFQGLKKWKNRSSRPRRKSNKPGGCFMLPAGVCASSPPAMKAVPRMPSRVSNA